LAEVTHVDFWFFFFLVELGFELRALYLQNRHHTSGTTTPVHFALVILEMESQELFVQVGLELRSSQFQSPMYHWCLATYGFF
jgi:hypothetical protein